MNARTLAAFFLIASASALGQSSLSRATLQQSLGFEDQTDSTLTSWHSYPPGSVSADNQIAHSGHWSVRLRRDAQSTGTFSVITRSVPSISRVPRSNSAATYASKRSLITLASGSAKTPTARNIRNRS
jgi:hypothetical protein